MSENYEVDAVRPLPKDWEVKPLVEVSTGGARNGYFKKPELVGKGYKLINVSELYQPFGIDTDLPTVERVEATQSDYGRFQVVDGDTFFTRSSLVLGGIAQCNVIRRVKEPTLFECHVIKIAPDKSQVCPEFVAYSCRDTFSRSYLMSRAKQTTMTTISQPEIEQLPVPIPPLLEQRKIAKILTTVDNQIEKTEALIAKYQAIKQGMMHDLFTRGVDEHGHLRPPYDDAPELYKESELGWIPKDWEGMNFGKYITAGPQNGLYKPDSAYSDEGTPIVRIDGFYDGNLCSPQSFRRVNLSEMEQRIYGLKSEDILINRVNSIDFVGKSAIIPDLPEETVFESNIMRLKLDKDQILPQYVIRLLCSDLVLQQFRRSAKSAVAQASINQDDVRKCFVAVPTVLEQKQIVERSNAIDAEILLEKAYLEKLKATKTGLMQDLLTGKVRVKIDESEEVFEAHA